MRGKGRRGETSLIKRCVVQTEEEEEEEEKEDGIVVSNVGEVPVTLSEAQ